MADRMFTDEELEKLSESNLERTKRAIRSGNVEEAIKELDAMYDSLAFLHDCQTCWISSLMTHIYNKYGAEALKEAELEAHSLEGRIQMPPPESTDLKTVVEHTIRMMSGHVHQPVSVEEDDEKVVITAHPCGSGNRVAAKGWYEQGIARVAEPCDITWGYKDFPIYCVHCPVQEMLEIDRTGYLKFAHETETADGPGEHFCKYLIYKNRDDIPAFYYDRIGKQKPPVEE